MNLDSLGDRMKRYELACRTTLPGRMPVIVRVDGKSFHSWTRGFKRPFDDILMTWMDRVGEALCEEMQGAVFAYVQSDEVSVLLHGYKRHRSQPWFENEVQKMVSVSASLAASVLTGAYARRVMFDSRAFVLPESDVCNYFVWRQQDATRNSVQMVARSLYSHRDLHGRNCSELQDLIHAKGQNWNDLAPRYKRGRGVVRGEFERDGARRHFWEAVDVPIFSRERSFFDGLLATEPEGVVHRDTKPDNADTVEAAGLRGAK